MKVGVLMAAYNAAPYIRQALLSVVRQQTDSLEFDIVVVNDGSTDNTPDLVTALDVPQIRLVSTPNQGVTRARNVALEHLSPDVDLFTWLDADDLYPEDRFARDTKHFSDPAVQFIYGYGYPFREARADGMAPLKVDRSFAVRGIMLGTGLYRRRLADSVGPFDPQFGMAEDTDWLLRLFESESNFRLVDDICLHYRRHDANMTIDHAAVTAWFNKAVAKSVWRRRRQGGHPLPKGLFDFGPMRGDPPW